jgi:MYXO-CTERM domain-containing protein
VTVYDADADGDGVIDSIDVCPNDPNPGQDLDSDADSCGDCGVVCTATNGTAVCISSTCTVTCGAGLADCDDEPANGCEVMQTTFADDEANCGGCGMVCAPSNGVGDCVIGECQLVGCNAGFVDCNSDATDGCEYAESGFMTDPGHCGDCTTVCLQGEACVDGTCFISDCEDGTADCDAFVDGCETDTDGDVANCGGCGLACSPTQGMGACVGGTCTLASCDAGFEDCDGMVGNGCEYDAAGLASDESNCGACGAVCDPPDGTGSCVAGDCVITECAEGTAELDGNGFNGCEGVDLGSGGAGAGGAGTAGAGNGQAGIDGTASGGMTSTTGRAGGNGDDPDPVMDAGVSADSTSGGATGSTGQGGSGAGGAAGTDSDVPLADSPVDSTPSGSGDDDDDDDPTTGAQAGAADAGVGADGFGGDSGGDGCGCRTVKSTGGWAFAWVLSALTLLVARRRRVSFANLTPERSS